MATSRRPPVTASERPQRRSTQRLTTGKVQPATTVTRPDPATAQLLQVLAEEIEDLRTELLVVREEVAVLRTVIADRKVTGSYRGITKSE